MTYPDNVHFVTKVPVTISYTLLLPEYNTVSVYTLGQGRGRNY